MPPKKNTARHRTTTASISMMNSYVFFFSMSLLFIQYLVTMPYPAPPGNP